MTTNGIISSSTTSSSPLGKIRKNLHIVGINVTHTIAPPMHNHIAASLDLPSWSFTPVECPTVTDCMTLFCSPDFAGGVVTMPYKKSIMPHLDELDQLAQRIGACNCVYLTPEERLRGTNTDWRGIVGCLLGASAEGRGREALIVGAGGASRAAVYALFVELGCPVIYVINRDRQEVVDLVDDVKGMLTGVDGTPKIVHVEDVAQAAKLPAPFYVVGTVPDFEPTTPEEMKARDVLEAFLQKAERKGVLLDMCFKPRVTRNIKLAKREGWETVEGIGIIGHQIEEQWKLWAGKKVDNDLQRSAWSVLREAADSSEAINF
jgi:quinate dehydrogenase